MMLLWITATLWLSFSIGWTMAIYKIWRGDFEHDSNK